MYTTNFAQHQTCKLLCYALQPLCDVCQFSQSVEAAVEQALSARGPSSAKCLQTHALGAATWLLSQSLSHPDIYTGCQFSCVDMYDSTHCAVRCRLPSGMGNGREYC